MVSPSLLVVAGRGEYPLELVRSARTQGVDRVVAIAFKGETRREIESICDEVVWLNVGHLGSFREAVPKFQVAEAVMAGQITPSNLFRARLDKPMLELLGRLPRKNADTIFGAVADELAGLGVTLLPAHRYLESCRVGEGILTGRQPTDQDRADARQGMTLATTCARLQAGQSVAIKEGTVIAVEGFEGTDEMIQRAGRLAGAGAVIVKAAQPDHDERWDIPLVGLTTLKSLRKARCRCLVLEADRVIMLEQERLIRDADAAGICVMAVEPE